MRYPRLISFFFLSLLLEMAALNDARAQIINTVAGTGSGGFSGDGGPATAAQLLASVSVAADLRGGLFISDKSNNRIRYVNPSGVITTLAGTGAATYGGDGGPATAAQLNTCAGIAVDNAGNVYIADQSNHRIRKIDAAGIITTIAGTGMGGFSGDGGFATAAQVYQPEDVAVDNLGNIFIADYANYRVRKINSTGIIETIAGNGSSGSSGDGGPATAGSTVPYRLAVDGSGNVYLCEYWFHKIRKINGSTGVITTAIGTGTSGFYGDGGPATGAVISYPYGVAIDKYGELFINDQGNRRIRKVNNRGYISTYGGTGTFGYTGDHGPATNARIGDTRNVANNDTGDIYIADISNHCVRVIRNTNHAPYFNVGDSVALNVCLNTRTVLATVLAITDRDTAQTIEWSVLSYPLHGTLLGFPRIAGSTGGTVPATGTAYNPATGYTGRDSFVVRIGDGQKYDTITVRVRVSSRPSPGVISGPSSLCMWSTITLTESVTGGTWRTTTFNASITSAGLVTGLVNGLDTVWYIVRDSCGIDSTSHPLRIDISVDLPGITGPDSLCEGHYTTLYDSRAGGTWKSADSTIARSLGGGVFYGVSPGTTEIWYIFVNGCGADTSRRPLFRVLSSAVCTDEVINARSHREQLQVSPNPTTGTVFFRSISASGEPVHIVVTDLLGRQVNELFIPANSSTNIDLSDTPGLYFYTASSGAYSFAGMILVTR